MGQLRSTETWDRLQVWEPSPVDEATLELVHTQAHVEAIRQFTASGGGHIDADTVASPDSWDAALRAAGALVEAVQKVSDRVLDNAFCAVRPPGHHATPARAMGFCLFNNIAIAAEWLLRRGRAQRLAILDYDVHHGNGTQDAFDSRPEVVYVSTHQYPLYPGTGHWRETGVGNIVNIALPPASGDEVISAVIPRLIEPAVRRHRPDFILVSLGFDAFWNDPLASMRYSIGGAYTSLLRSARDLAEDLCGGRIVVALEGGYDLGALAHGTDTACRFLLGEEPAPDPLGRPPEEFSAEDLQPLIDAIAQLHRLTTRQT